MTKPFRFAAGALGAVGLLYAVFFLQGCADSQTSSSSFPLTEKNKVSATRDYHYNYDSKIWVTIKEGVNPSAIKKFIECMGCTIEEIIPPGGQLYVVLPPEGTRAEKVLPKFQSHPWIERASVKLNSNES